MKSAIEIKSSLLLLFLLGPVGFCSDTEVTNACNIHVSTNAYMYNLERERFDLTLK